MPAPYVFISYSWDSPQHKQRVMELANRLRREGIEAWIDQWEDSPPETWQLWCFRQVAKADFVLVVCTETYNKRVLREDDPGTGRGVSWEGGIISGQIYDTNRGQTKFVPAVFSAADVPSVPFFLNGYSVYNVDDPAEYSSLALRLKGQHQHVPDPVAGQAGVQPSYQAGVQPSYQPGVQPSYQAPPPWTNAPPLSTLRDIIEWAWVIEIQNPGQELAVMRINLYGPRTGSPAGQRFEAQAVVGPPGWRAAGVWETPSSGLVQLWGEQQWWVQQQWGGPSERRDHYQVSVSFSSVTPSQLTGMDSYGHSVTWRRL